MTLTGEASGLTAEMTGIELARVREALALALDVDDLASARALASRLALYFGVVKIGLQLFVAAGPTAVEALVSDGFPVFLDLKLHDIPNTVARAAERARDISATYLTVHAAGGETMLRAAVEAFGTPENRGTPENPGKAGTGGSPRNAGSRGTGGSAVTGGSPGRRGGILAVTVLTSEAHAPAAVVAERAEMAMRCGCVGVVCAASDLAIVREVAPELLAVVPGVRLAGSSADDQARMATPGAATVAGAGLLVIGRTVSGAGDPEAAALRVAREVASV